MKTILRCHGLAVGDPCLSLVPSEEALLWLMLIGQPLPGTGTFRSLAGDFNSFAQPQQHYRMANPKTQMHSADTPSNMRIALQTDWRTWAGGCNGSART